MAERENEPAADERDRHDAERAGSDASGDAGDRSDQHDDSGGDDSGGDDEPRADDSTDGDPADGASDDGADPSGDESTVRDDGDENDRADADRDDADRDDADRADADRADADRADVDRDDADRADADRDDADRDDADRDDADRDEDGGDEDESRSGTAEGVSALPSTAPAPFVELMAAYRQPATAGGERLPWSWTTLSAGEAEASAAVLDGFVESYNRTWAIGDDQALPRCWHLHPALAHDLSALAWAYYQAYRDPMATPDQALRFQAHLLRFADRVDRWLGADPVECRAGRHPASWRATGGAPVAARGSTVEDTDAVILLGRETFGFVPPPSG